MKCLHLPFTAGSLHALLVLAIKMKLVGVGGQRLYIKSSSALNL